jgi:hypothetical protein
MFRPVVSTIEFDLAEDLLGPTLALHVADAEQVADAYLGAVVGPVLPVVLDWSDFVETLIHARSTRPEPTDEPDESSLEFHPDPKPLVDAALLATAHQVLIRVPLPARLSALLAACSPTEDTGAATGDLFVAAALRGFDNSSRDTDDSHAPGVWADTIEPAAGHPAGEPQVRAVHLLDVLGPEAACVSDGTRLRGTGWHGEDLIVCVDRDQADAVLLGELSAPQPTRLLARLRRAPNECHHRRPRRRPAARLRAATQGPPRHRGRLRPAAGPLPG